MAQYNKPDLAALLSNRKAIEQIAGSSDAQALASMLSKGHDQAELEKMTQSALGGDTSAIQALFRSITENPESAELLRRLGNTFSNN